ncbi:hypothetical protein PS15m_007615 [Mucor circinelloides]
MLLEVINGPWSNTYLHFESEEGTSVFCHKHSNKQLQMNGVIFIVHPAKGNTGDVVKYAHKEISFAGSPAAMPARAAAMSAGAAPAPTPAAAHSSEWVASTKRALISIDLEIRDLNRRRKLLRKALKRRE